MRQLRSWFILLFASMIVVTLAGCADEAGPAAAAGDQGTAAGSSASPKILKVRFYDDPAGFDPATIFRIENENIAFNIFSGLTTYDSASGRIVPDLAEKWENQENKVWTFHLRKGVKWQKGYGELTAKDVLYSFQRTMDPKTASPYSTDLGNVDKIEAPDDYTVVIHLKEPDGNFLHVVANYHQGQIMKQEAVDKAGANVKWEPVGTGPYALESINPNSQIVLVRHDDYFGGKAPIQKIVFNIIKDEQTAAIALQNGEVDLLMRANLQENLDSLEKAGFTMNHVDNYATSFKVFNLKHPILSSLKVRQAFAYAIDYTAVAKATSPKLQSPPSGMLLDWMDVYSKDYPVYPYNPEKAKSLLAEAGYPNGFKITQSSTSATGVTESMQLEKEYLSKVGIDLNFELMDTPTYNKKRNNGEFDIAGRLLPAVNPDMILFSFLHPDNIAPKGLNGARYNNPELTEKLVKARSVTDDKQRKALYADVQKMAMTDLAYLPMYNSNVFWPGAQSVSGVVINKLAQVNFFGVDMTPAGR
jgi:ABC-type transport system substrate-binding protein